MLDGATGIHLIPVGETLPFDDALENFYGNLRWRIVEALTDLGEVPHSPIWIAEKLKYKVEDVLEALDGLQRLGLIEYQGGKIIKKKWQFIVPEKSNQDQYLREQHVRCTQQLSNELLQKSIVKFGSTVCGSNIEIARKFTIKLQEAFEEFEKESKECVKDGLYSFAYTGVDVLSAEVKAGAENSCEVEDIKLKRGKK